MRNEMQKYLRLTRILIKQNFKSFSIVAGQLFQLIIISYPLRPVFEGMRIMQIE